MKGIVRGVLGLTLAFAAAACTNDETLEVGGDFDKVSVDKEAMFVSVGDSSAVLVRLVNDLNSSTPTSFTVSGVGSGIEVHYDALYRPDYTGGDTLIAPEIKPMQRYWVVGTGIGLHEFTLTSSGASTTVRVRVTPDDLGNALSATTGVVAGQELTLTAPTGLRFNDNSVVTFIGGGPAPVITNRAADGSSISFLVGPGVSGVANVTNVSMLFAPAAPNVTLRTTVGLDVPAITSIPVAYSTTTPAAGATVTVTAPGFKFLPTTTFTFGTKQAFVVSTSADSLSATIFVPAGVAGTATVGNVVLANLPAIALNGLSTTAAVTTVANYPALAGTVAPVDGVAPTITAAAPGTGVVLVDAGPFLGPDAFSLDASGIKYYKLVIPTAGSRTVRVGWDNGADIDFQVRNAGLTASVISQLTSANPETGTFAFTPGTYWIVVAKWSGVAAPDPNILITVK